MTLGLPAQLMRSAENRAMLHAGHTAAFICLSVGIAIGVLAGVGLGSANGWIGAGLVAAQASLLVLHAWRPVAWTAVLALAGGAAAVVLLGPIILGSGVFESTNNSVMALPLVALVLIGGSGRGTTAALAWAGAGFAVGAASSFAGARLAGATWELNHAALFAFLLVAVVRGFDGLNRRFNGRRAHAERARGATPDPGADALSREFALRASVRLNETALRHLSLVAASGSGPVDDRLRAAVNRDLSLEIGPDWVESVGAVSLAVDDGGPPDARFAPGSDVAYPTAVGLLDSRAAAADQGDAASASTPAGLDAFDDAFALLLPTAFDAARNSDLEVRVSGDPNQLADVEGERLAALDAAVAQCLVNVARHAGVPSAELMIGGGPAEVTVAVIDAGVGFDEARVPGDRIGLRTSIRARIELAGGTVRIWSTLDVGTTIVLTMPRGVA